ncbi:type III effector Hrp-dependent outer protein [Oleidesulfovibrio alaskensis G20]|jgi:uncharacterized protein YgbK (DUF1537 family)|uniref:Type III effector Hrp-dependent outer protein n=1 Tax=Oleidesulfovibrio alaskensis (strain ATCC BAA-1058 / DSM 17464 / G20) TaxID=207559 RepID=Q317G7_OLEA2|nr:four-carbon acid sugar kinase family protein [Oleidesulfovibrio alaskensis]ABB36929.1 type III effector Hrp-dependent outer protein [Oleidesulfovibrio alaskensis G20]MBG0774196.1 four-carbon acid sugar kinase family protein [Oleidesulfovibrio alaskensis]
MTRYAVIADDLTGAGDTGVQFAKAGLRTRILTHNWSAEDLNGVDVAVVQTESRAMPPQEAYAAVKQAAQRLQAAGVQPLYKKVDSTLRGQIGPEIDAVMDVWGLELALLCPAFPENGRTLIGGYLLAGGEPVSRTSIGADPVSPVRQSHIPSLLAAQSSRPAIGLSLAEMTRGDSYLESIFTEARRRSAIIVADAADPQDIALLESLVARFAPRALFVGSAGLAAPVAARLAQSSAGRRPVVTVVGSVNPVSRGQLKQLQHEGTGLLLVTADELLLDDRHWQTALRAKAETLAAMLRRGEDVAVATPGNREEVQDLLERGAGIGLERRPLTARVAARTTQVVHEALALLQDGEKPSGLVLTGGDMAHAMLAHLNTAGMDLIAEVSPGIPVGRLSGGHADGVKVVTKAGGFGTQGALVQAVRTLRELD